MKILITGITGFVSSHFLDYLNVTEPGSEVMGIARNIDEFDKSRYPNLKVTVKLIDLLNKDAVGIIVSDFEPEYILHLASVSSVALSWKTPLESFVNNTNIFLNLVEVVRAYKIKCRILSIGSSEEYGEVTEAQLPLTEEHQLRPVSPYAVARVSQEMLSAIYAEGFDLDIIITRSFNHIGPGQKDKFVVSSFAKQLVQIANDSSKERKIITGDLSITRDFLDVRDVAKAYYILLKQGKKNSVYNICSGRGTVLKDIITILSKLLNITINTEVNPQLIRPNENRKIMGSYQKMKKDFGWQPEISLEQTLADIIAYWQNEGPQ
ncbi:GDP-mannose 4,6-dehydratase [Ferruginibacter sp.]|nr:NAD-dependent epimerase/dehydratase family protein [Ferruginibacter sp.]